MTSRFFSTSQAGQDCWVYGEVFNEMRSGFFLDIGAHNGIDISNSYILETRYNWQGICVEANPKTFPDLRSNRRCRCINACIDSQEGSVDFVVDGVMGGIMASDCGNSNPRNRQTVNLETTQLATLLDKENAPRQIDYLSIDIEGAEDRALLGFDFDKYLFKCITIERPSAELRALLERKGFILIKEIPDLDCFYIHSSFKTEYLRNLMIFGRKRFLIKRWSLL